MRTQDISVQYDQCQFLFLTTTTVKVHAKVIDVYVSRVVLSSIVGAIKQTANVPIIVN